MSTDGISLSQSAWNEFAEHLKKVGEKITGPTGARNPRERAEGYRYLMRLISGGHELEMEVDRRHPVMARMMTPLRKFKGDGTDTLYREAKLDESLHYRFTVRRGDDLFYSTTVYAYNESDAYYIVDHLIDDDTVFENVFGEQIATIYLSADRPEGVDNWIELKGRDPILFTREYFPEFVDSTDKGKYRPAIMTIDCLDVVDPPSELTEQALAQGLRRVSAFIEDAADVSIGLSVFAGLNLIEYRDSEEGTAQSVTHITDGEMHMDEHDTYSAADLAKLIDPKLVSNNLPGPGIQYLGAWFKLEPDEAILIEGRDVPCRYWSCQILTRYLESGDFRFHKVGINNRQVKFKVDGRFQIFACAQDPGVDNWVCTQGYTNAHILIRTLMADPLMEATFKVVKLSSDSGVATPPAAETL